MATYALAFAADEPADAPPLVTVIAGGKVVGTHVDDDHRTFGCVIAFDQPLATGDTAMLELRVDYPEGYPSKSEHVVHLRRPLRELVQWFRFSPDGVPAWVTRTVTSDSSVRRDELELDAEASAGYRLGDLRPGSVRVAWGSAWEDFIR